MSWAFLLVSLNRFFFFIFSTLRCMEMTIVSTATNGPTKTRKIKKKINLFNTLKTVHTGERKKENEVPVRFRNIQKRYRSFSNVML